MLSLAQRWVHHAIVNVAVKFSLFRSLQNELNHFEAVTFVNCAVVTLHAEVLKDEMRTFFEHRVVESLEVKLAQV